MLRFYRFINNYYTRILCNRIDVLKLLFLWQLIRACLFQALNLSTLREARGVNIFTPHFNHIRRIIHYTLYIFNNN